MTKGKKRLFFLFALVCSLFVLMVLQQRIISFSSLRGIAYPFTYVNSVVASIRTGISDHWHAYEDNKLLKKELTGLRLEQQRYQEVIRENERIRELLTLTERNPKYVATCRVIARGYDRLLNTLLLDKGSRSGIRKDMAVVTAKGLVGRIHAVGENHSEMLLLWDPNFSVAVRFEDSRREGVVSGTGQALCVLKYLSPEEKVEKGEVVITSGLDGIFPQGIPVGAVSKVSREGSAFYLSVVIQPFQPSGTVEEVVILKRPFDARDGQ